MTDTESPSGAVAPEVRRQQRRGQRRDRVYEAALHLFTEHGYDGTTMDDIAEHAEVARSSVFNYFARKSTFLDDWARRRRARAFGSVADPALPLRDQLVGLMSVLAEISAERRAETVAMFGPAVRELNLLDNSEFAADLTDLVTTRADEIGADVDPLLVGLTLATGYFAVLNAWCKGGSQAPFDLGNRLRELVTLVSDGMNPAS